MPTLYQRITGSGFTDEEAETMDKISIHVFKELMHDFNRGNINGANLAAALNMDDQQTVDATTIYQKSNLVANKEAYFNRLFGHMVLAESRILPDVYNETNFWAWINGIS